MYLLSQWWTYLLLAAGLGALLGAACYAYCRRGGLQSQLRALRLEADTEAAVLRGRLADVDGQRMQAVDRLNGLDAQFETLRTSSERALEAFAERIRDLESSLHARESQFRTAEARIGAEVTAHAQTRTRLQQIEEALRGAEAAHAAAVADRDRLEQELAALRDEVIGARGLVQEINATGRGREEGLHAEIASLQNRLGETRVRLTAAQQGEYALKAELESQSRRHAERDEALAAARSERDEARAALTQSFEQASALRAELDRLSAAVSASEVAIGRHGEREVENAGARRLLEEEAVRLRTELADAAATAAAALERARKYESSEQATRQELMVLESRQRDAEQVIERLRAELGQQGERQSAAGTEAERLRRELATSQEALASQRARAQSSETELADLRRQLVELSAQTKHAGAEEQRLRDEMQRLMQRESAQSEELGRLRRETDEARNGLRIAKSREETLIAEIGEMRAKANTERAAAERLAAELNAREGARSVPSNRNFQPSIVASMEGDKLEELVLAAGEGRKPDNALRGEVADMDDLKEIGGIGPVNEKWLHDQGIFHFWQIASWMPEELAWVAQNLPNFGTRVYRENWVAQATRLARGETTDAKRKYREGKHR